MKKALLCLILLAFTSGVYSQAPNGFLYQALVKNASGQPLASQSVSVKLSLLVGAFEGESAYSEVHSVVTSPLGVVSIVVGTGVLTTGNFLAVPWDKQLFIKFEVDPNGGGNFVPLGTSQIVSVPYAIKAAGLAKGAIEVKPSAGHSPEAPIFIVRNSNNQIVYAVYEDGVRFNVGDNAKSTRGGFAVGGLVDQTKGGKEVNYLTILPDSVRFNIVGSEKSNRGGFAVGGLVDQTKEGVSQVDYMILRPDSIRFAIDEGSLDKSSRGGFAIGGLVDQTKSFSNYFIVSRDCTFVSTPLVASGNVAVSGNIFTGGSIVPLPSGPVTDYNGNVYPTIRIGSQTWMAENLRSINYNNGDAIQISPITAAYPYHVPRDSSGTLIPDQRWGLLYNLQYIDPVKVCPIGWRLPSAPDWMQLIEQSGGFEMAGGILKDRNFWHYPTNTQSNGFNSRPTGYVSSFIAAGWFHEFLNYGTSASFWSRPEFISLYPESKVFIIGSGDGLPQNPFNTVDFPLSPTTLEAHAIRCIKIQ